MQVADQTQHLTDLVKIAEDDPLYIAENVLGIKFHDEWQKELIESVWDAKRFRAGKPTKYNHEGLTKITVRSGHGPGKTFSLAELIHLWLFCHRTYMPCLATAPKQDTLKSRLFPTLRKIKGMAVQEYQDLVKIDALKMSMCGDPDWGLQGETATAPENLAGYHDDYMLVVVDEASGLKEEMFPVIDGAVSTGIVCIQVLISNPTKTEGTFWQSHNKAIVAKDFYKIHVTPEKSTRLSRKWIEQMENKYGKDSPVVKVRCRGEFANLVAGQIISYDWLEQARFKDWEPDGSIPFRRLSIDVSDGGEDETVFTIADHYSSFVVFLKGVRKNYNPSVAIPQAYATGVELFEEFGMNKDTDDISCDAIGVGAGVAGLFIENGYQTIRFVAGSTDGVDTDRYKNQRTQSSITFANRLKDGRVVFDKGFFPDEADWDDFTGQSCSIKKKESVTEEKIEELEPKRKLLKSPDLFDSGMQQFCDQIPVSHIGNGAISVGGQLESTQNAW